MTHFYKITVLIIAVLFQFFLFTSSSNADEMVGRNNFTATPLVAPKPQTRSEARDRLALVNAAIKKVESKSYSLGTRSSRSGRPKGGIQVLETVEQSTPVSTETGPTICSGGWRMAVAWTDRRSQ